MNQEINVLLQDTTLDKELKKIAKKVADSERISDDDALLLYQKASLGFVGILANFVREKKTR